MDMQTESQENRSMDNKPKVRDGQQNGQSRKHNNNHHVVPLGILIVLSTVYLMIAGLQINYNYYFKAGVDAAKISKLNDDSQEESVFLRLERNDVDQPLCRKIDIFTISESNNLIPHPPIKGNKRFKSINRSEYGPTGGKQSKALRSVEGNKKKDTTKKSNTAEPIIYLFALVFIYLLLKAASDINQHYKSQNKGDKRLRRCSLQSYAQKDQRPAHLDRRASKEPRKSRRLSVPISINYQTINISSIVHPELARRGSVISLGSSPDMNIIASTNPLPLTTITPDIKRRVRMINRH